MNIVAIGPWYPANSWRYLIDAFERSGHTVIRQGPAYNDHAGIDWGSFEVQVDREWEREAKVWNFDECVEWSTAHGKTPDLLIVSEENYQTDIIPTTKVPSVLISYDGWSNSFARKALFQPTVAFTNHPMGVRPHPLTKMPAGWHYLPGACAPWVHVNRGYKRRPVDFALYATPYGPRPAICQGLRERGFVVGSGLVDAEMYVHGFNEALCTFHNANRQLEIKWRAFEAFAMGCVVMSDPCSLFAQLGYQSGVHYLEVLDEADDWPTIDAIADCVRALRQNPERAAMITTAAEQHTLAEHTYFHRVKMILDAVGL